MLVEFLVDRTSVSEELEATRFSSMNVIAAGDSPAPSISSVSRLEDTQMGRMVLIANSSDDVCVVARVVVVVVEFHDSVVTWKTHELSVSS